MNENRVWLNERMICHSESPDLGYTHSKEPGIYLMPAVPVEGEEGEPKLLTPNGSFPQFSADGKRVFYQ